MHFVMIHFKDSFTFRHRKTRKCRCKSDNVTSGMWFIQLVHDNQHPFLADACEKVLAVKSVMSFYKQI